MVVDEDINNNDISPKLSYKTTQEKKLCLSKVAENWKNTRSICNTLILNICLQCGSENHPNMIPTQGSAVQNKKSIFINILLLYDPNTSTDPEIWDGGFHPISLHGLIIHITSDAKNIKNSLKFMAKYITNKQVELSKTNDLDNFNGIGDVV